MARPLSANATILPNNSLIARIVGTVDKPGLIYVEYRAEGVGRFRSRTVASDGTNYAVHVVRLRANTEYRYQVFGATTDARTSRGPSGTFVTGKLPPILKDAQFNVLQGRPTHRLTHMEFKQPGFWGLVAIDGEGHVVWYYDSSQIPRIVAAMAQKSNGNIVYHGADMPESASILVEINPLGEELDRLEGDCPRSGPFHHEVHLLPDGEVMYVSTIISRPGFGDPLAPQKGDLIGIWNQKTHENKIVWNVFDHVSPSDRTEPSSSETLAKPIDHGGCAIDQTVQDWSHGNSAYMADDGSVLISMRHLNQIISIEPEFKSIQWRLGGPGSDFAFPNPSDKFYQQHTAVPLSNGNVLLFDNGNLRPIEEGGQYSRALELELDLDGMEATKVWEYRQQPDIFAVCCSATHRLENGNTLLNFGFSGAPVCCRPFIIVEVDPDGNVVWELEHLSEGKPSQYRVYPSDSVWGEVQLSGE